MEKRIINRDTEIEGSGGQQEQGFYHLQRGVADVKMVKFYSGEYLITRIYKNGDLASETKVLLKDITFDSDLEEPIFISLSTDNSGAPVVGEREDKEQTAEKILDRYVSFGDRRAGDRYKNIIAAMTEFASLKEQEAHNRAVQECLPLIERCEKTFGKIDEIFKLLLEAQPEELYSLVREIDIDIPLIQAMIKDEVEKLKK